ncbi:MAG TPA: hypothetical protein VJP85_06260 [Candidatus Baltobacteraceae bacterium]|nr:hypothetical protein [Candidatus Baltobacteraceae bacterium]
MENHRETIHDAGMTDKRMRDRNITDETPTIARPKTDGGEITSNPEIDDDAMVDEDEATRNQIGAGE